MMRSLYAGVSGLKVHQTKMDVIGNNIANVNTPGYKKSRVTFQEMLNQTISGASSPQGDIGGINPMQIGLGVSIGSIDVIHSAGSPQSTGKTLDMAIEGEGYFVVGKGANRFYTRAGNFDFDYDYSLVTSDGLYIQGWVTDPDTLELNAGDMSKLTNINLGALASKTINRATSYIEIGKNLDRRVNVSAPATYTAQISQDEIDNIDPADPTTYLTIQLPESAVFNENFSIGSISYGVLMANRDKWEFNPATGELIIKDNSFPANETQKIDLRALNSGSTFTLNLPGIDTTGDITVGSTYEDTAQNIESALNGLSLGGGVAQVSADDQGGFYITFSGGSVGETDLNELEISSVNYNSSSSVIEVTKGGAGIDEIQEINLDNFPPGTEFTLNLTNASGTTETTLPITVGTNLDETRENIENALNNLGNLGGGTVTVVENNGNFQITFSGGDIGNADLAPITLNVDPSTLGVTEIVKGSTNGLSQDPTITYQMADHQTSIEIYDSQGSSHKAVVTYYKSGDNKWLANVAIDGEMVQLKSSPTVPANYEFLHEIEFDSQGEIISGQNLDIYFVNSEFGNSVDPLEVNIDFSGLTQVALDTTAVGLSQDGFEPGSLESISVDTTGKILGTFSNGQSIDLAQVALATFRNPAGLLKTGNTLFQESKNSGEPQLGIPGTDNKGVIKPESLEMSNVDLSEEFVEMITTQRGFQANSRIITTSDEMLQELVNLRR